MSPQELDRLIEYIENDTGILLPDTNHKSLTDFLQERFRVLGTGMDGYIRRLKGDREEYAEFLDNVTINETYFFREERHFKVLESEVLPLLDKTMTRDICIWSAACSTGEEALSLAALAQKKISVKRNRDFFVYASDLNPVALDKFRRGEYRKNSFRGDGKMYHPLVSSFAAEVSDRIWRLKDNIKKHLRILEVNLYTDDLKSVPDGLAVIFLRNILIYMDFEVRKKIISSLTEKLMEGGYLFLSSSEMPLISHPELLLNEKEGIYFFRKKTPEQKREGVQFDRNLLKEIERKVSAPHDAETAGRREREKFNVSRVCDYANQKLNNPLYKAEGDGNYTAAIYYLRVVVQINNNDLDEALKLLGEVNGMVPENEIGVYLRGYIDMIRHHEEGALESFEGALSQNAAFWPARFYLGLVYKNRGDARARKELELCAKYIDKYIRRDNFVYQFLLEGFNAKYFLQMCEKWKEKLGR